MNARVASEKVSLCRNGVLKTQRRCTLMCGNDDEQTSNTLSVISLSRSLSDLAVRSEASGRSRPVLREFEAHSGVYVTKIRVKKNRSMRLRCLY